MTVRDILSNRNPQLLTTVGEIVPNGSSLDTVVADLSTGTTAVIYITARSAGFSAFAKYTLQFSVDQAFTDPVDDPLVTPVPDPLTGVTESGNILMFGNSGDLWAAYNDNNTSPSATQTLRFAARILNPPSTIGPASTAYRYARILIENSGAGDAFVTAFAFIGPQRYVAAE